MRHLLRLFAFLAIMTMVGTLSAPAASAQTSCTDQYMACINVAGQLKEPYMSLADAECGLEYAGCLGRKLKFW
jgi:hypothetical protein